MVMFLILSLISCHFETWGYFFIASKRTATARPGSRPCIVSPRNCFLILFSWSSGHVRRVVLPGLGFLLPLVVFFRFLRWLYQIHPKCHPCHHRLFQVRDCFCFPRLRTWKFWVNCLRRHGILHDCIVLDCGFVILNKSNSDLKSIITELVLLRMKSICFYLNDFYLNDMLYKVPFICFREVWKKTQRDWE